jgi:2-polyprenyl-3-methyl-5-hydroxy-6-metoxy-1,4-benzoquinol methylase
MNQIKLRVNGGSWMGLNLDDYREVFEFYSHYTLSKGKVLCSGMGLLIRESWILSKGVNVTLVENNENIIQYHKTYNPELCSQMNIIHGDIHDHKGEYDVILLDHYEHEKEDWIIEDVKNIMNNTQCDTVWFWPLERIIRRNGGWEYYVELKKSIPRLPDLDEVSLNDFLGHYYYYEKN